jgi:hypothetical protein
MDSFYMNTNQTNDFIGRTYFLESRKISPLILHYAPKANKRIVCLSQYVHTNRQNCETIIFNRETAKTLIDVFTSVLAGKTEESRHDLENKAWRKHKTFLSLNSNGVMQASGKFTPTQVETTLYSPLNVWQRLFSDLESLMAGATKESLPTGLVKVNPLQMQSPSVCINLTDLLYKQRTNNIG